MTQSGNKPLQVWAGRHVEIEVRYEDGETEVMALDVVADAAADFTRGFLGEGTPLGQAILGKSAGDVVNYRAGDIVRVRVLAVRDTLNAPPEDLTGRRAEVTRKALEDADKTSLLIYASSMNSKWGDYDPAILQEDEDAEEQSEDQADDSKGQNA